MVNNTYCPIFRVGDVVRYAGQDFTQLADKVRTIAVFSVFESTGIKAAQRTFVHIEISV